MLKGEVLIPFVAQVGGRKIRPAQGDIIDIPANVDWVAAGFVRVVEEDAPFAPPKKKKANS